MITFSKQSVLRQVHEFFEPGPKLDSPLVHACVVGSYWLTFPSDDLPLTNAYNFTSSLKAHNANLLLPFFFLGIFENKLCNFNLER